MRIVLIIILGVAVIWDGFTTVFGTNQMLGGQGQALVISLIFAALIIAILLSTSYIFTLGRSTPLGIVFQVLWVVALCYDLYTSYVGNQYYLIGPTISPGQIILLLGITIFVSGSSVLVSMLVKDFSNK